MPKASLRGNLEIGTRFYIQRPHPRPLSKVERGACHDFKS
jgi:hypothetical protein